MNWCGIVGGAANSQGPLEKPKNEFILMEMTHIRADQPSQLPEGKPGAVPAANAAGTDDDAADDGAADDGAAASASTTRLISRDTPDRMLVCAISTKSI